MEGTAQTSTSSWETSQRHLAELQATARRADASTVVLVEGLSDFAAVASLAFFVCVRDLEDELIRALGCEKVERVMAEHGDLASLRRMQRQPFHRGRSQEQQLHRFLGTHSGRKLRYATLLAEALEPDAIPSPLAGLLDAMLGPGR